MSLKFGPISTRILIICQKMYKLFNGHSFVNKIFGYGRQNARMYVHLAMKTRGHIVLAIVRADTLAFMIFSVLPVVLFMRLNFSSFGFIHSVY